MKKQLFAAVSLIIIGLVVNGFGCEHASKCGFKKSSKTGSEASILPKHEIIRTENSADITLVVAGMTCTQCGVKIEDALFKVEGIQGAVADLEKDNIVVTYDKTKVKMEQILKAINDSGYEGSLPKES